MKNDNRLSRSIRSGAVVSVVGLSIMLLSSSAPGQANQTSQCNTSPAKPISYVALPGHPFSTISSKDGCWLFVSLTSSNPKSANGVALLSRKKGQITLKKVFPVEAGPTGMILTHDGKLLILADDEYVVFMDVLRMTTGQSDPILGYVSDGNFSGSVYVNVTADDKFLFVSDENTQSITVINLERVRAQGFSDNAIVGKVPVGEAPIALTFSPDEKWLYTTSQAAPKSLGWPITCKPEGQDPATAKPEYPSGAVIVIDVEHAKSDPAKSVFSSVPAGCNPVRMGISPAGDRVYVTARNSNAVLAFDTNKLRDDTAHALIGTVPVGTAPVGVVVVNDGSFVIVSNSNRFSNDRKQRQTLSVIDTAKVGEGKLAVVGSLGAGVFPREFGQSPDGRTLFVANYLSDELEVIDLTLLPLDKAKQARSTRLLW